MVLIVLALLALAAWVFALLDALVQSPGQYRAVGLNKDLTVALVFLGCFVGAAYYLLAVRPRVARPH